MIVKRILVLLDKEKNFLILFDEMQQKINCGLFSASNTNSPKKNSILNSFHFIFFIRMRVLCSFPMRSSKCVYYVLAHSTLLYILGCRFLCVEFSEMYVAFIVVRVYKLHAMYLCDDSKHIFYQCFQCHELHSVIFCLWANKYANA